jgi:hypothetical protein
VATSLVSTQTAGASGNSYAAIPLGGTTVGNQDCTLSVRTGFGRPETDSPLERLMLRKVQVAWQRQVSPAPAVASFLDVPPGHLFFQFVEALVKSGITGGCGGGNFCPDATLTRGQMAAFLAKALGLQWP